MIAGTSYAFWDILLPTEEAVALTHKTLENKEYFFRTEYIGRRQTTVSVYEVPSFFRDANLAAFMLNFGDIVSATHDGMRGEWRFDIMLDAKTFYSVPNWLNVEGHRLPVIVSGRKPACLHCGEIGHLSAICPGKKAPKKPDQNPGILPPVVTNSEKEAPVVSPTSAGKKQPHSPMSSTVSSEEAGAEWLTVGKGGRKIQPADPHSRKSSQVGTNSSPTSKTKYAQQTKSPSPKYSPKTPPKQPTPPKVRSFRPGREKFEQLLEFKKQLDLQRKATPKPGPSRSTPSSPNQPRTFRPPTTPPPKSMPPPTFTSLKPQLKKGPPLRCRWKHHLPDHHRQQQQKLHPPHLQRNGSRALPSTVQGMSSLNIKKKKKKGNHAITLVITFAGWMSGPESPSQGPAATHQRLEGPLQF